MLRTAAAALIAAILAGAPALADPVADCEADGDWAAKRAACTEAIDSGEWRGTDLAWAYNNRGVAENRLGSHTAAVTDYNQALALLPDLPEALNGRANARCQLGEVESSIDDRMRALELGAFLATEAQEVLKAEGFYGGAIDGLFGPGSRAGLLGWTKAGCPGVE